MTKAVAGPDGAVTLPFTAPTGDVTIAQEPVSFQATDGTNTTMGGALLAQPGVVVPRSGRTRFKMRTQLAGFEAGQVIYAHVRWGEKWRQTVKLGTAAGPCGTIDVRNKLLRKTGKPSGTREVYVQYDFSRTPARDTHQTAYARFFMQAGRRNPENYSLVRRGWRERTGI